MSKLFVLGSKSKLANIVSKLQELKVAHIIEHKKDQFDLCTPLQSFDKVSSLLVQVRSIISHLKITDANPKITKFKFNELENNINKIKEEVNAVIDETKNIENEISLLSSQKEVLKQMALLDLLPEYFHKSNYITSYFGYINNTIKEKLNNVTNSFEIKTLEQDKKILTAIFVDSRYAEQFDKLLIDASFSEIDVSSVIDLKGHSKDLFEKLLVKNGKLETTLAQQNFKIKKLVNEHSDYLANAEKFLSTEAEKAQAPLSFGSTKETFFMRCFLPQDDVEKVKAELMKSSMGKLHFADEPLGENEGIPIKLKNSKYSKNYEFFTKLFALPKYNEYDPSTLMAYTFPLFMGFMLGDLVYGLIIFALFYWLKKKFPFGKDFFNIMMSAGVSTAIFGIFFGEVAGFEPWHGIIVRTHDFSILMAIALIVGIIHVNFGLLLGFILEYKNHSLWAAITHKFSWVLIQIGGTLFIGPALGLLSFETKTPFYIGMGIFFAGAFLLYKAEGFIGVMELPTIVSHILSYARLMAVGLASVFIAVMVNQFSTFLFNKGILFMPLALIAFIVGQTFALALGILSPSLHSVRLHYVEFFTKFYAGGGQEYKPFGAEEEKSIL